MGKILKFVKWYFVISVILAMIVGLYSCATETEEQKAMRKAKGAIEEVDRNFSRDLKAALEKHDGDALVRLYHNAKSEEQKEKLINGTNSSYMKWLSEIRDKERLTIGLKEELLKYYTPLAFAEQIKDPKLADLQSVRNNIGKLIENQERIDEAGNKYGNHVQVVDNPEQAQWMDIYVAQRVESPFNIKLGNINLTEKYTDQYRITSYKSVFNSAVQTDTWEAIATFKKDGSIQQGVKQFYAVPSGEGKFTKSGGFDVTLPIFVEVTKDDIEYSYQVKQYRLNIKNFSNAIYQVINQYVPPKTRK